MDFGLIEGYIKQKDHQISPIDDYTINLLLSKQSISLSSKLTNFSKLSIILSAVHWMLFSIIRWNQKRKQWNVCYFNEINSFVLLYSKKSY